jgi:LysR family glycine cleavage system transcriptional activator
MTIGPFAIDEIKAGRLVQPFPLMVPHRHQWQFACKAEDKLKPKIRRFEDWLVKQVAADPALHVYR